MEWAGFLGGIPTFALSSGQVVFTEGGERRIDVAGGLALAIPELDQSCLIAGGEDGTITRIAPGAAPAKLQAANRKWVNALAIGPSRTIAASCGRTGRILPAKAAACDFVCERTIEAMAFAPKGLRLALARYNGVELRWVNSASAPQFLEWKGAHVGVTFSPDGRFVVSTMQENALHGWRLADNKNMRMTGYPAKVRSVSWSPRGKWLASSGAPAAIVWPFSGKDGPMGKAPKELGGMGKTLVSRVCCHPLEAVVAIGYQDGMITAVRIEDEKIAVLRRGGYGAISTLNWDAKGQRLAFGTDSGEAGIVDIAG